MGVRIRGIEYHFPNKKLSNEDLALEFPDYDFNKFEEKVGVKNRYIVEHETALDLAEIACAKLFKRFDKNTIDYVLYCTQSPEYYLPTTACILQDRIGLRKNIGALDFNLGCSGYTYGLSLAKALINSNQAKNILLVTAETYSRYLNPNDKSNRAIFGDAATATLIERNEEECFGNFLFGTDGAGFDKLIIKNGGKFKIEANATQLEYGSGNLYTDNDLYMNGPEVFNFTSEVVPPFTLELLVANQCTKESIDQFVFHQANAFMLNFMRKRLKIDPEKFYIDLKDGGNTVSCTIPIALKRYVTSIEDHKMENILVVGFGVGLSWSGGLVKLDNKI